MKLKKSCLVKPRVALFYSPFHDTPKYNALTTKKKLLSYYYNIRKI